MSGGAKVTCHYRHYAEKKKRLTSVYRHLRYYRAVTLGLRCGGTFFDSEPGHQVFGQFITVFLSFCIHMYR